MAQPQRKPKEQYTSSNLSPAQAARQMEDAISINRRNVQTVTDTVTNTFSALVQHQAQMFIAGVQLLQDMASFPEHPGQSIKAQADYARVAMENTLATWDDLARLMNSSQSEITSAVMDSFATAFTAPLGLMKKAETVLEKEAS